jgi:ABC-type enterobactin transport system permease subunit
MPEAAWLPAALREALTAAALLSSPALSESAGYRLTSLAALVAGVVFAAGVYLAAARRGERKQANQERNHTHDA